MIATKKLLSVLFTGAIVASATAADYYVASDGTYEGAPDGVTAYTSLDDAIAAAGNVADVIHVEPGTYATTTQWGPNLAAKLIGTGTSRDDVVIQSAGTYRTLRMAADSWLENVTVVGVGDKKADKGGAVEMNGGTITNCVFKDGYTTGNNDNLEGGNLYIGNASALVVDSLIQNGHATKRGGNVYLNGGTVRSCTIEGGTCDNVGGNVFIQNGNLEDCIVRSSSSTNDGGGIYIQAGMISGCTISNASGKEGGTIRMTGGTVTNSTILANGTTTGSGGGVYMTGGTVDDCYIDGEGGTMSWHGGCIYMKNGTVKNTVCTNGVCTAAGSREGGNIYMENGTLENVTLADGQCAQDGGNLRMTGGTAKGLVCIGGIAGRSGGNICAHGSVKISGSTLSDGTAVSVGGNLYAYGSVTVEGCDIAGGVSKADGGNIRIGDTVVVSDSTISGGTIVTDEEKKGANVYMDGSAKLIRCHMSGGTSFKADGETIGYNGGSVCSYSSSAVMEDCLVAGSARGGILLGSSVSMYNCSVVANEKYGIWGWSASKTSKLVNCVFFGNQNNGANADWTGDRPTLASGAVFDNCAATSESATLSTETYSTLVLISSTDFADYANGDYRPAAEGKLVDAGALDERADASTKDLDGNPRLSEGIDIGCYEYQHTDMTVAFTAPALDVGYAPATATFTASAQNAPGDVSYDVNFGDGTLATYTESQISHVYSASGTYTISVTAVSGVERSKPMTRTVKIVDKIQRVGEGGHATIQEALDEAVAGCEVILAAGVYEVSSPIVVNKAVTVSGEGSVVVRNTAEATSDSANHRVMEVSGGALVAGLVIENGRVINQYGGNLRVADGIVSNCVIRGGTATANNGNAAGGGLVLGGQGGIVTHCQIVGNLVDGTSNDKNYAGAAVFVEDGTKNGRLSNLLVANNRYVSTDATKPGAAGVRYGGRNDHTSLENCTIVSNTVEGALLEGSAGLYCTSWHVEVRNCVIAGNYETGKQKYTSVKLDFSSGSGFSYLNNVTDDALIQESGNKSKDNQLVSDLAALFKNFANGDYRPKTGGALVDKGTTTLSLLPSVDLAGNLRQKFAGIDIGCYECQLKPGFSVVIR